VALGQPMTERTGGDARKRCHREQAGDGYEWNEHISQYL
jgi:hypothetical protein